MNRCGNINLFGKELRNFFKYGSVTPIKLTFGSVMQQITPESTKQNLYSFTYNPCMLHQPKILHVIAIMQITFISYLLSCYGINNLRHACSDVNKDLGPKAKAKVNAKGL